MNKLTIAAAAAALSLSAIPTYAATQVGRLECKISGGVGFIIGSSKRLNCAFTPADSRLPIQLYWGRVNKFGLDVGATGGAVMEWMVLAPSSKSVLSDALAGNYVGASAEATAGAGVGANVLVGGSNRTITLQPLSVQGQTGLNLAVGVSSFNLHPAAPKG